MLEVVEDVSELPQGAHCLSLHASREEGARNAVQFLAGALLGQAASYWVPDEETQRAYQDAARIGAPLHVGCIALLPHSQVTEIEGHLRPAEEIREFLRDHPSGVTAAGETLTRYWTRESVPAYLEYENWFETQGRDDSRFMCPYDLREVPSDLAPVVLRSLGSHHSHVVLSRSDAVGVRLLELFVFGRVDDLPDALDGTFGWALKRNLIDFDGRSRLVTLTPAGDEIIREWSEQAILT